jgi:hypothetical protein
MSSCQNADILAGFERRQAMTNTKRERGARRGNEAEGRIKYFVSIYRKKEDRVQTIAFEKQRTALKFAERQDE